MYLAVVTARGLAKLTASRELADLAVEHLRRRIRVIATRGEAERAIREALAAAEQDARLKTVRLGAEHDDTIEVRALERRRAVTAEPRVHT